MKMKNRQKRLEKRRNWYDTPSGTKPSTWPNGFTRPGSLKK